MKISGRYFDSAPILPPAAVGVLAGLNRDYLDLLITGRPDGVEPLETHVMQELRQAGPASLDSMAACSYALFALDPPFPLKALDSGVPHVNDPVTERYGAGPRAGGAWTAFATTALFFAWHLSRNSPLSARVMLGFPVVAAEAMAALEPWQLRHLADQQPAPLRPRWSTNPCFWPDLIRSAAGQDALQLDLARLLGLQLLAADLQPGPCVAERRRRT
jgi:hypothetical protein